jgi:hypothetical protein
VPAQIVTPTTTIDVNNVVINWQAPVSNNGAEIFAYKILIRESDIDSYSENLNYCDGSTQAVKD